MDFNMNNVTNKPSLPKSGSKANFSHAAVNKTDVGDFKEGYFVMADMPQQQHRPHNKTHKTPERNQRKNEHHRTHQSRERSTKDIEQLIRESDTQVSHGRVPTSPTRSPPRHPKRNFHSPPQSVPQTEQSLSPHKPRKAQYHHEKHVRTESNFSLDNSSGSPPKDKGPSPPSSHRWAGPAFSNAPPPSSLPMPEFPPFQPSASSPVLSSSPILSSSPPPSGLTTTLAPQSYIPSTYAPLSVYAHQPAYSVQLSYADAPSYQPQHLAQLSTDLRRMLNISQPISA